MSGAGSSDPDGDALTYAWSFGDGSGGTGPTVSHSFAAPRTYAVRLIVTDIRGLSDTTSTTAVILTPRQAIDGALGQVAQLVTSGALSAGDGKWTINKLDIAAKLVGQADENAAVNQLREVVRRAGDSGPATAALVATLQQLIQSILASETP